MYLVYLFAVFQLLLFHLTYPLNFQSNKTLSKVRTRGKWFVDEVIFSKNKSTHKKQYSESFVFVT